MLKQAKKVIWVLQGARMGDNAQARELASRIGMQVVYKQLNFNTLHNLPNFVLGASTLSLQAISKKELLAPWPDLVIATGKRCAPVARWIKQQSRGQTKIVHLGRPRAPLSAFDLVISTPQYGLPRTDNVIEMPLPFVASRKADESELDLWNREWAGLRKPLIAVAIGSAKFPLIMGARETQKLARQLNSLAEQKKGSLLLIASPRTAPDIIAHIESEVSVPHMAYASFDPARNPYQAALAMGDHFVVTSDSISMISELVNTGKPVDVFELPHWALKPKWSGAAGLGGWLSRSGLLQPPRDVAGMVRKLIESGFISILGEQGARVPLQRDDALIIERLKLLLDP